MFHAREATDAQALELLRLPVIAEETVRRAFDAEQSAVRGHAWANAVVLSRTHSQRRREGC